MITNRPWGSFETIRKEKGYKVKKLTIYPHQRLSLQYHLFRSELWMIVKGTVIITLDESEKEYNEGDFLYIPIYHKHRISNMSDNESVIIEIQYGEKCVEDDIIRIEDDYKRILK